MKKTLVLTLLILSTVVPRASIAQYMYLDTNGNGVHDAGDVLDHSSPTVVDVWLSTNQDRGGVAATCPTSQPLSMGAYEIILHVTGGTVAWSGFVNRIGFFISIGGEASSATDYHNAYGSPSYLSPGLYRLCSVTTNVTTGNPYIAVASWTPLSLDFVSAFATECPGIGFDATYILGRDWFDVDGAGDPTHWVQDGLQVCGVVGVQSVPDIAADGSGGGVVVWEDRRSGNRDIYVQRLDGTGRPLWVSGGVAVCTNTSDQYAPRILSDGSGGAYVVWRDARSDAGDIYAQRVRDGGSLAWPASGVAVCTAAGTQQEPATCSDGSGGLIVTWTDRRNGDDNIYAQRIDSIGTTQWTAGGVGLVTILWSQYGPRPVPDGTGGAIVAWTDYRQQNSYGYAEIYSQRVSDAGVPQWTTNGVPVSTAPGDQRGVRTIPDGSGGAIITWDDSRGLGFDVPDIYAQRLDASGAPQWTTDGVAVCAATNAQRFQDVASDGVGGFVVTWQDHRGPTDDIYGQRLSSAGQPMWTTEGVQVCAADGDQYFPRVVGDMTGGAVITWEDRRASQPGIYAQRVLSGSGDRAWGANGVPLGTGAAYALRVPVICSDGFEGAIAVWEDDRNTDTDIYGQRVALEGGTYITAASVAVPERSTRLFQNRPNPFNPRTAIRFTLGSEQRAALHIFDIRGRLLRTLVDRVLPAGSHDVVWDGRDAHGRTVASGVFWCRLTAGDRPETRRMVLLK